MKSLIRNLSIGSLLFFSSAVFSQQNYTIKSSLKIEGLPAEYAAAAEQEMVTYIKNNKQKTEMTGMMGSTIIFFDGKTMTHLNEQMGQKNGYSATKEEMEAAEKDKKNEPKPKIEYTNEKKTIAGYECSKAIATTSKDGKEEKIIVWYTDKIKIDPALSSKGSRGGMMDLGDLKGYPLVMEMNMNVQGMEIKTIISAEEVLTTPIDDSVFVINTEGYKMMSYKEWKSLQASMGK